MDLYDTSLKVNGPMMHFTLQHNTDTNNKSCFQNHNKYKVTSFIQVKLHITLATLGPNKCICRDALLLSTCRCSSQALKTEIEMQDNKTLKP